MEKKEKSSLQTMTLEESLLLSQITLQLAESGQLDELKQQFPKNWKEKLLEAIREQGLSQSE